MANLVVYVDLHAHPVGETGLPRVTGSSRFALQAARKVARSLGATVHAIVATGPLSVPALESLALVVGRAGADRVLVCSDPGLSSLPLHATHGAVLSRIAAKLHPRLFLFPSGSSAAQLAAPLAAELRAVFFPGASVSVSRSHLLFSRALPDWEGKRVIDILAIDRPVVAVLAAGKPRSDDLRAGEAELHILSLGDDPQAALPGSATDADETRKEAPVQAAVQDVVQTGPMGVVTTAAWEDAHTVILLRGVSEEISTAPGDVLPEGVLILPAERPHIPTDILSPTTLILINPSMSSSPPVIPAADAAVVICSPKKPTHKFGGVTLSWKSDLQTTLPELLSALAAMPEDKP